MVLDAQQDSRAALEDLCRTYWMPIYVCMRRWGSDRETAEDLTQGYFADLLARDYLGRASKDGGKFRAFLLQDARLYAANMTRREQAEKRGGRTGLPKVDPETAEAALSAVSSKDLTPEQMYDRQWAMTVLANAMRSLEEEHTAAGKLPEFQALHPFLAWNSGEQTYATVAASLQRTEDWVKQNVKRLRKRFRALLEAEVAHTVAGPDDIEEEMRYLASCLK